MFHTDDTHTVTVRRPDPESDDLVAVDVEVPAGGHERGDDADFNAALEHLFEAQLAHDDDRPHVVEVTDIVTGDNVVLEEPKPRRGKNSKPTKTDDETTPSDPSNPNPDAADATPVTENAPEG